MIVLSESESESEIGWKVSIAHSWIQKLPLKENMLVCRDCQIETKIGQWNLPPCNEHIVDKNSGWN